MQVWKYLIFYFYFYCFLFTVYAAARDLQKGNYFSMNLLSIVIPAIIFSLFLITIMTSLGAVTEIPKQGSTRSRSTEPAKAVATSSTVDDVGASAGLKKRSTAAAVKE